MVLQLPCHGGLYPSGPVSVNNLFCEFHSDRKMTNTIWQVILPWDYSLICTFVLLDPISYLGITFKQILSRNSQHLTCKMTYWDVLHVYSLTDGISKGMIGALYSSLKACESIVASEMLEQICWGLGGVFFLIKVH